MWLIFQIALIALWFVPAFSAVPAIIIFAPSIIWAVFMVLWVLFMVIALGKALDAKRPWRVK